MTRCYECLEQCVVGVNGSVYDACFTNGVTIQLPFHHLCAAQIGLKESAGGKE